MTKKNIKQASNVIETSSSSSNESVSRPSFITQNIMSVEEEEEEE